MSDIYQYNKIAKNFSDTHQDGNKFTNIEYFQRILPYLHSKVVLDAGCGDGADIDLYLRHASAVYGIDSSSDLISIASEKNPKATIIEGAFDSIPFDDNFFDVVLSKYALQTIESVGVFLMRHTEY